MDHKGHRLAVISAGWADGFSASYWDFDASGCPCALATDFDVLDNDGPWLDGVAGC